MIGAYVRRAESNQPVPFGWTSQQPSSITGRLGQSQRTSIRRVAQNQEVTLNSGEVGCTLKTVAGRVGARRKRGIDRDIPTRCQNRKVRNLDEIILRYRAGLEVARLQHRRTGQIH